MICYELCGLSLWLTQFDTTIHPTFRASFFETVPTRWSNQIDAMGSTFHLTSNKKNERKNNKWMKLEFPPSFESDTKCNKWLFSLYFSSAERKNCVLLSCFDMNSSENKYFCSFTFDTIWSNRTVSANWQPRLSEIHNSRMLFTLMWIMFQTETDAHSLSIRSETKRNENNSQEINERFAALKSELNWISH